MEYRQIVCPHCGESMQAPEGRESIICMFCGKTIALADGEEKESSPSDRGMAERNREFVRENIAVLFTDMEGRLRKFGKETYAAAFENYRTEGAAVFNAIDHLLMGAEDKEELYRYISGLCADKAEELLENRKKIQRENYQMNLNMHMAVFVLPAIREGGHPLAERLTEEMCGEWKRRFKGSNIKSADFETIQGGFKRKLCYITTAVCRSMNKPEDCYELALLKNYRDRYMLSTPEGEEMVRKYYDIAPTIVKRIDKEKDAEGIYRKIWEKYLKPCISCIENDQKEECAGIYGDMVRKLQEKYVYTNMRMR